MDDIEGLDCSKDSIRGEGSLVKVHLTPSPRDLTHIGSSHQADSKKISTEQHCTLDNGQFGQLPSFAMSEFETIIRRQRAKLPNAVKTVSLPSRFCGIGSQWEFAGWGSLSYLSPTAEELSEAQEIVTEKPPMVGSLRASSLPGNSMTASVFYAFPAVVAVSSVFSPVSLLIACLILFLWKPIFLELGSAIRVNGANYAYLSQVSGTTMGLLGASITLLDAIATSTESAATAASYLQGEISRDSPLSTTSITIFILTGLALFCLLNIRESSRLTLMIYIFHLLVMLTLMIASIVHWARQGSDVLLANWDGRPTGTPAIAKTIFNGVCIGFLGVTGFETTPAYIEIIPSEKYSKVLRNVLFPTLLLNAPMMLFVYVVLPSDTITKGVNILSILAETLAGKWLRTLVVIDCVLVLSGSVIGGFCSSTALLERLAKNRVFPQALLKTMPLTGTRYNAVIICFALNMLLFAITAFNLATISALFTVTFLSTLLTFIISSFLLKYNCNRLPRSNIMALPLLFLTFMIALALLIGNVALAPKILGIFLGYFSIILLPLVLLRNRESIFRLALWAYCQTFLQKCKLSNNWYTHIIKKIKEARQQNILIWIDHGDIHDIVNAILYVRRNETTAHIIIAHAYQIIELIPTELSPNIKILDEAFPAITLDLMFVQGAFNPTLVEAVSMKTSIPTSKMFMMCPGDTHPWHLADYRGVRIISQY